jgi:hypothetical protein
MIMCPDGARNQELLCRGGPAVIYWTGLVSCEPVKGASLELVVRRDGSQLART